MADKVSWTDLRRILATRSGVSEKKAQAFLNSLNSQLIEAIKSDKQVKINGLGTFKLQSVAPRKSVDVSTGEEITIAGYNKLVFSGESGVKELVEKSVAGKPRKTKKAKQKDVSEGIDPLQKLGVQAAEIVDLLGELGQAPEHAEAPKAPKTKAKKPTVEEEPKPVVEEPQPVVVEEPQPVVVEEPQPTVVEEPQPVVVEEPQPVVVEEPQPIVVEEPKKEEVQEVPKPEKKKKKHHFWRDTLICVVVLLVVLVIAFFFFRSEISHWIKSFVEENKTEIIVREQEPKQTETIAMEQPAAELNNEQEEMETEEMETEEPVGAEEIEEVVIEDITYDQILKTEKLTNGSRLAWIARKYYGSHVYWPYLYDANKDRIDNPNKIMIGTPIRVPKLSKEQKDTTNVQTMATLDRLRQEAEEAIR